MNVIILGSKSDIMQAMMPMIKDWTVYGWSRGNLLPSFFSTWYDEEVKVYTRECVAWDLAIVAMGRVAPVGPWHQAGDEEWEENVESNLLEPIKWVRDIWSGHRPNASVCFMAGSNPNKPMANYVPYSTSKMALLKMVEHLDFETPDAKFFALAPGYVQTKIHNATLAAGIPNERIARGGGTPIEKIYDCLRWCVDQPKEVVGGRNICVSDPYGPELAERLKANPSMFKLRRIE